MTNGNFKANIDLNSKKAIHVAVAVLRYGDEFLLARRHTHQHQGGKLEFVGGKIEQSESPISALIREVDEELGLDINENATTKMGRIWHDYGDKAVYLHVYQVLLTDGQYVDFRDRKIGCDGQEIGFFERDDVLRQKENFPAANAAILAWLTLPNIIIISHELGYFNNKTDWLDCYKNLPKNSTLLVRTKNIVNEDLLRSLIALRTDLRLVISLEDWLKIKDNQGIDLDQIVAIRLTHHELINIDLSGLNLAHLPIIASCHDLDSLTKANELAKLHPVMAVLLSPVKLTATHPDASALGWKVFEELAEVSDVPVIGLGGLSPEDLPDAHDHGAVAVAGIREFL